MLSRFVSSLAQLMAPSVLVNNGLSWKDETLDVNLSNNGFVFCGGSFSNLM